MGADQDNFGIRYRKTNPTKAWKKQRDEIADFIFSYADEVGVAADGDVTHFPTYSEILMEEAMGHVGDFCGLPDEMVKKYPDVQFEFHFIEWYGNVSDYIVIYDGNNMYSHDLEIGVVPESADGDPYFVPDEWLGSEFEEDSFMNPCYYFIDNTSKPFTVTAVNEKSEKAEAKSESASKDDSEENSSKDDEAIVGLIRNAAENKKKIVSQILRGEKLELADFLPFIMGSNAPSGNDLLGGLMSIFMAMQTPSVTEASSEDQSVAEKEIAKLYRISPEDKKKIVNQILNGESLVMDEILSMLNK